VRGLAQLLSPGLTPPQGNRAACRAVAPVPTWRARRAAEYMHTKLGYARADIPHRCFEYYSNFGTTMAGLAARALGYSDTSLQLLAVLLARPLQRDAANACSSLDVQRLPWALFSTEQALSAANLLVHCLLLPHHLEPSLRFECLKVELDTL